MTANAEIQFDAIAIATAVGAYKRSQTAIPPNENTQTILRPNPSQPSHTSAQRHATTFALPGIEDAHPMEVKHLHSQKDHPNSEQLLEERERATNHRWAYPMFSKDCFCGF
jgi:hypothetical protein